MILSNILEEDPTAVLERYFRQCSINVSCRDLAVMGATLANGGVNPVSGERAIRGEYVESVLGVMGTCGMDDYAGQGELAFATAEVVVRRLTESANETQFVIINLKRVLRIDQAACRLLAQITLKMRETGRTVVFAHIRLHRALRRSIQRYSTTPIVDSISFEDANRALEYCEDMILSDLPNSRRYVDFGKGVELLHGLAQDEIDFVEGFTTERRFTPGKRILRMGDIADSLFILLSGRVSIMLPIGEGYQRRLASFAAGMVFGEMAFFDKSPRPAMVNADTDVLVRELTRNAFEQIGWERPKVKIQLLENLFRVVSRNLRKANQEISILNR